jgi:tagatose-1,6-bisphosphate aldolase non-catalytic subunit AgaZ/GatZ
MVHPETLCAILAAYRDDEDPILIEVTCNQVNQDGSYIGMTLAAFRRFVERLAKKSERGLGRRHCPLRGPYSMKTDTWISINLLQTFTARSEQGNAQNL